MIRAASVILLWAAVQAQQFEVVSIKVAPLPKGFRDSVWIKGGPGTDDPGLFSCHNVDVSFFITSAYGLAEYQLSGPPWMEDTNFDMSAKIPEGTTKEQFAQMMQSLLTERFKLAFHRDKKEMPSYSLVVAKGGPKMKASSPSQPAADDAAEPQGPLKRDADGFPILQGHKHSGAVARGYAAERFVDETMDQFAGRLAGRLGKPVIDETGLTGKYDFDLHWVMNEKLEEVGPNLFRAVSEQLGLKLESKKNMVDIFVVDRIEKTPTEN